MGGDDGRSIARRRRAGAGRARRAAATTTATAGGGDDRSSASATTAAASATTAGDDGDDHRGGRRRHHRGGGRRHRRRRAGHAAPRLLPERHPRPGDPRRRRTALFAKALGPNVKLELSTFNAGTDVITAMFSDALDASFIGPNPAINGYAKSEGDALRIVAGTTSGGASLVVSKDITSAAAPQGQDARRRRRSATPRTSPCARGSRTQGLTTDTSGGGDVSITPQENADTLNAFSSRRHLRGVGARAVGDPPGERGRRPRARQRGRPVARRQVRHDPPDRRRGSTSPTTPTSSSTSSRASATSIDQINADPAKAQTDVNAGLEQADQEAPRRRHHRRRVRRT